MDNKSGRAKTKIISNTTELFINSHLQNIDLKFRVKIQGLEDTLAKLSLIV